MDYGNVSSQTGGLETGYNNYNATGAREDVYVSKGHYNGSADIQHIPPGKAFRGEVTDINTNQITIRLDNGNTLQARLAEPVGLHIGESLLFQVKSNENGMIEIRPVVNGMQGQEATILKALTAAGLPVNEKTVVMLQNLLNEQMPINKESLQNMYKLVLSNQGADIASLVQMSKHNIPLTKENIGQFEAYKNYEHRISTQAQTLSGELVQLLGELAEQDAPAGRKVHEQLLKMALPVGEWENASSELSSLGDAAQSVDNVRTESAAIPEIGEEQVNNPDWNLTYKEDGKILQEHMFDNRGPKTVPDIDRAYPDALPEDIFAEGQIGRELSGGERMELASELGKMGFPEHFAEKIVDGSMHTGQLLEQILNLSHDEKLDMDALIHNKAYTRLLQGVVGKTWFMTPAQLADEKDMQQFYERLSANMKQLDAVFEAVGKTECSAAKTAGAMRENIDFMNQINQMFNYVQIPLKMAGKTAHSDLYVFSKKRQLMQKDGRVSALLHLELEALGSLDIYVEMDGMSIRTQFKVADEELVGMFREHMDFLDRRIHEKGYQFEADVEIAHKQVDFVQDFLEQDHSGAPMQRFAFDVRA